MERDALAWIETQPHGPLLPLHLPPVDREAGALGLGDLDRLDVVAEGGERRPVVGVEHELLGVVARGGRQRHHPVVLDVDDPHGIQIERHDQALDRPGVAVLGGRSPHEGQRPTDQRRVVVVVLGAVVAGRPGIDHREVEVGDPTFAHRLLPARIGPHLLLDTGHVLDQIGREPAGDRGPRVDDAGGEVDGRLVDHLRRRVVHRQERPSGNVGHPLECQSGVLLRLCELDHDESQRLGGVLTGRDDRGGRLDLHPAQRVQGVAGVAGGGVGAQCGAVHRHRAESFASSVPRSNTAR